MSSDRNAILVTGAAGSVGRKPPVNRLRAAAGTYSPSTGTAAKLAWAEDAGHVVAFGADVTLRG